MLKLVLHGTEPAAAFWHQVRTAKSAMASANMIASQKNPVSGELLPSEEGTTQVTETFNSSQYFRMTRTAWPNSAGLAIFFK